MFSETGLGDMGNDELTETEQPQPDDAEVSNFKAGDVHRWILTDDDTHSSARVPGGPDFGCGSCVGRSTPATGQTMPKGRRQFPQR